MKRFPHAIRLALLSFVAACSGDKVIVVPPPPPVAPPKIVSIVLSLPDSLVVVARPVTPATIVTDADGGTGGGRALKWASSDTSVATVSVTGVITGWSVGFATITADADGARGTLPITVAFGPPATIIAPGADTLRCVAGDEIFGLPTVFVLDQTGRPVPGVAVSVRADSSAGTIVMSAPSTDAKGGVLVRRWISGTRAGKQHAVVTAKGLSLDLYVAVRPSAPTSMMLVSGSDQDGQPGARLADPVAVRVTDTFGNGVSGVTVSFAGNDPNSGTLSAAAVPTDTTGRASTIWTLPNRLPSSISLSIRANGLPTLNATALILGFTAKMVATGIDHSCAIDLTDRMWCWGYNGFSELGVPSTFIPSSTHPVLVPTALKFVSVSASEYATCAIATDGQTYCWGNNATGQLADPVPSQRRGIAPIPGMSFTQLSMQRGALNCGTTAPGDLYCWQNGSPTPQRIAMPERIAQATGRTCALGVSKTVYCWSGDTCIPIYVAGYCNLTKPNPTPTAMPTPEPIARLANGMITPQGPCGISVTAKLYCTRAVMHGFDSASYPLDSLIALDAPVVDATNGYGGSACAVTTKGSLFCWGPWNDYGMLGTGDTQPRTVPTEITQGRFSAVKVSSGYLTTCAIDKHSQVWCWGAQVQGLTYTGGGPPILSPTLIVP